MNYISMMETTLGVTKLRRIILLTSFLVLLEIALATNGLQCHLCASGETSRLCNATSNIVQCGRGDVCYTTVDHTSAGLMTRKGCMARQQCERYKRQNDHLFPDDICSTGVVRSRCTWCCSESNCNYDLFEYSQTTPRPTLPTTTIQHTLSTIAPPTCRVKDFTKCTEDFSQQVDLNLDDPRNHFPEFCQNVPDVFLCVMNSIEDCYEANQQQVHGTLQSVSTALLHACPGQCSPAGASDCTRSVIENACEQIVTAASGNRCTLVTKEFYKYEHCITFNTGVCTQEEKFSVNATVSLIKKEVDLICNESMVTTERPPVTRPTKPPRRDSSSESSDDDDDWQPVRPSTRRPRPPTTKSPHCRADFALQCVIQLGKEIAKYLTGTGDLETICRSRIPAAKECVQGTALDCSDSQKDKIEYSLRFVEKLLGDQCEHGPTTAPPKCDTIAARQCVTKLYGLIDEADDFQSACKEVDVTKKCVKLNSAACTDEEKQSLQQFLQFVLNRIGDRCDNIVKADCNKTITLVEGGPEEKVTFTFQRNPEELCAGHADCHVFVDVVVETGEQPQCKDGKVISQVVVRQDGKPAGSNFCSIEITRANWRDLHKIIMAAKIDLKYDGNQTREVSLVYRKVVGGVVKTTRTVCSYTVVVMNRDSKSQCKSVNDPHLVTFDGHYYNNFYEGVFTLYKHKYLPYEVQAIYQRCSRGSRATCNCGVAVRSGDFVFFADRCRRKAAVCRGSHRRGCGDLLETYSYEWDSIPAGTRVFRHNGGRDFEILLPHGTTVKFTVAKRHFINIWIHPSPYDWKSTEGLCGTYDGNRRNDFTLPNGNTYKGPGRNRGGQPRQFSLAWRVPREGIIYHGVKRNPFNPETYCECRPDPMSAARVQCLCAQDTDNMLVETCYIDTSGEIRFDIHPTIQTNDILPHPGRIRRQASQDEYDIDLDFVPPENYESGDWTEEEATAFCTAYLRDTFKFAKLCLDNVPNVDMDDPLKICVEDILITGETEWAYSSLEDLKDSCLAELSRNSTFTQSPWGRHIEEQIRHSTCVNQCSGHGQCEEGKCVCNPGWTDIDCGLRSDATPQDLSLSHDGLCSTRHANCSVAVVFGQQFIKSDQLSCHLQKVQVTSEGTQPETERQVVPAEYFTLNQIFCRLPTEDSFLIDVSNDGIHASGNPQIFVPHDSVCQDCRFSSSEQDEVICSHRTTGNCIIDGKCYAKGEKEPENTCNICDPDNSLSEWSSDCSQYLYIVAVVILLILVIVVIVVLCSCFFYRRRKRAVETRRNQDTYFSSLTIPMNPQETHGVTPQDKPVKLSVR